MSISGSTLLLVIALAAAVGDTQAGAPKGIVAGAASSTGPARLNWPQFRFDARHTGVNPFEHVLNVDNVPFLTLEWEAQLGQLVFASSPTIVGGVLYIGSTDGTLWAYPADGCGAALCTQPLWQSTYLAQITDSPTVANGIVYVGSQTSFNSNDGRLNAFAAAGCGGSICAPLWQGIAGKESILNSSPAVAGGVVYVGAFDGRLYAFAANGCGAPMCQPLWTAMTGGTIESSPTVDSGVVYIGSDDGNLYAFAADGCGASECAPLWTGTIGYFVYDSTPAIVDGVVYIGSAHALSAFDADGCGAAVCAPLWQAVDENQFFGGSPAIYSGRVYIGLETEVGVYSASGCGGANCTPLWLLFGAGAQAQVESSPTVDSGVVYIGSDDGNLYAFAADGCGASECAPLWTGTIGYFVYDSTPAIVDGVVYIGSAHALSAFDAAGCGAAVCAPLWQAVDENQFFGGSPAIYSGRVYIGLETEVGVYSASGCGGANCTPLWLLFGAGAQAQVESSPTIANGVVYVGRNTGQVLAWPAEPCGMFVCEQIWTGFTGDPIVNSSPTVARGKLYIGSADNLFPENQQGRVYVFTLP